MSCICVTLLWLPLKRKTFAEPNPFFVKLNKITYKQTTVCNNIHVLYICMNLTDSLYSFYCDVCDKWFKSKEYLRQHNKRKHETYVFFSFKNFFL